jgi:hypothetical protein
MKEEILKHPFTIVGNSGEFWHKKISIFLGIFPKKKKGEFLTEFSCLKSVFPK